MPDQSGRTTSRDFAFQSTDQAFAPQGQAPAGDPSITIAIPPYLPNERYDAGQNTISSDSTSNTVSNSPSTNQIPAQETPLRLLDFPHHNQGALPNQSPGAFANYAFSPGGPLAWDWSNSIDFPEFAHHYEPQGELVGELQNQQLPAQDFSIPLPVTIPDQLFQSPQPSHSAHSVTAQNPLSPPPPPQKAPQRPALQTGMKRKAESEPTSATSQSHEIPQSSTKRPSKSRSSSSASANPPAVATASDNRRASAPMTQTNTATAGAEATGHSSSSSNNEVQKRQELNRSKGTGPQGRVLDVSKPRRVVEGSGADILPAGKVFPIQIGSELFRLSGASISSDAPSYFSHFFGDQLHHNAGRAGDLRTLYIDRDPVTFRDISLHLQGYHVKPRDGEHFVRLFADAQFYSLPRLTKQLFNTDIFIRIGQTPFQIPRDTFSSPGDSPNYFSLGFAQFFSTPTEVFPGLDRTALLRPPSILPPAVPNRSGDIFAELLKMLQGYNIKIRDEEHRGELLRDARYFHLKGLEQRLIPCEITFNLQRNVSEILIRLEDIRQSGVGFTPDVPGTASSSSGTSTGEGGSATSGAASPAPANQNMRPGTVSYARPYTDDHSNMNHLILEISYAESTRLHFPLSPPFSDAPHDPIVLDLRATFYAQTLARITSLFSVVASKMGLPATQPLGLMMMQSGGGVAAQPVSPANSGVSESRVRVRWESDAWVELDGVEVCLTRDRDGRIGIQKEKAASRKRKTTTETSDDESSDPSPARPVNGDWIWGGGMEDEEETQWIVKRAHWRLRVEPVHEGEANGKVQIILFIVRLEAFSDERRRNGERGFLRG